MDETAHRENGRHKPDLYKGVHAQWMMPQHQIKDHTTIKIIAIMAERDSAIQERNLALSEKKAALAERDLAFLQRDAAISDRNNAIAERDAAIASLHYTRDDASGHCGLAARGSCINHTNHQQQEHSASHLNPLSQSSDGPYCNAGEMHITNAYPISSIPENGTKPRRGKHPRKEMVQSVPSKEPAKMSSRKSKRGGEDLNKQVTIAKSPWRGQEVFSSGEDLNKVVSTEEHEWRGLDLGLNQVSFDEGTMAVPGCSCTGVLRQCYKWGNGGWQSSCCTTTMSMHPLPVIPNKRHARIGGRKMSGSAFTKLLSRLAREGHHDLSMPVDLKDHWAKHGTNRYITIK